MNTPQELSYAASHEWLRREADGMVTVGITDFAQDQLGDVVFVELPAVGRRVARGEAIAVIESVKTASDIYAPVAGTVRAVNDALEAKPEAINESPYGSGWMFRLEPSAPAEIDNLLNAADYASQAASGA